MKVKVKSLSHVRLLATPWTVAYQAPPSRWIKTRILSIVPLCSSQPFFPSSRSALLSTLSMALLMASGLELQLQIHTQTWEHQEGRGTSPHASSSIRETTVPRRPPKTSRWSRLRHVPIPNQSREWDDQLWLCSYVQLLSCVWLCDPMDCSMPGFPVRYLLETALTHVHWVGDAIQPSHPLLPSFPPAFNLSQTQGLF